MPYHDWGDDTFDWKSLYEAQDFIYNNTKRYAFLRVILKEKYGTLRYSYLVGLRVGLFYSAGVDPKDFRSWLWKYIPLWRWFVFKKFFFRTRINIFLFICFIAMRKWPHIAEEIRGDLSDLVNTSVLRRLFKW